MSALTPEQQRLVLDHLRLAKWGCDRYWRAFPKHDRDDLYQTAVLGLIRAAARYAPGRAQFTTFAMSYIRFEVETVIKQRMTRGFSGLVIVNPGLRARCAALVTLSTSQPVAGADVATVGDGIPSRYDYGSWLVRAESDGPVPMPPSVPGVKLHGNDGYLARVAVGGRDRINLGMFSFSRYGGIDGAHAAAVHAVEAFKAFFRPGEPGRGAADAKAHLAAQGLLPNGRRLLAG